MAIEKILLGVVSADDDRLDVLASSVIDVAVPTGASVVVVHAFTDEEFDDVRSRLEFAADVDANTVAARHANVRAVVDRLEAAGVPGEVRGVVGDRGEAVVDLAEGIGADRVVVGGRRRSPAGKAMFGSTPQSVLLTAPCPTTFVRGDHGE